MSRKWYAKILGVTLVLALSAGLVAGCGGGTTTVTQTETKTATVTTAGAGQTVTVTQPSGAGATLTVTATPPAQTTTVTKTGTGTATGAQWNLKVSHWVAPTHHVVTQILNPWMALVEYLSEGRVTFTVYHAEALGKAADHWNMVSQGIADIGNWVPTYNPGQFPLNDVLSLPMAFEDAYKATDVYKQLMDAGWFDKEMGNKGVKYLFGWANTPYQMAFARVKPKTLEDLKGIKIRSAGGLQTDAQSALGLQPVNVTGAELYTSMQRGVIDAAAVNYALLGSYKLVELTDWVIECGFASAGVHFIMNQNLYNSFPKDIQDIFTFANNFGWGLGVAAYKRAGGQAEKDLAAKGVTPYKLPDAEKARWLDKVKPIWSKWAADLDAKGLGGTDLMNAWVAGLQAQGEKPPV